MELDLPSLVLVPAAAVAAVLLANGLARVVKIPLVVFEIVLGLVMGPALLGWAEIEPFVSTLADLGLVTLFFLAGNEIDFSAIRGRPLRRAGMGWVLSIAVGMVIGIVLAGDATSGVYIGVALASTALGTIMPVLRDAGELETPFGRAVTAVGAAGEFGPLLAISLFLSGRKPGAALVFLLAFAVVAGAAIWLAGRGGHRTHALITATLHSSGQFAVRLVVLIMASLTALSIWLGIDMLLGAFAAGVLFRVLLAKADADLAERDRNEARGRRVRVPRADLLHQHRYHLRPRGAASMTPAPCCCCRCSSSFCSWSVAFRADSPRRRARPSRIVGPSSCSVRPPFRSSLPSPPSASRTASSSRPPRPRSSAPGCCPCSCSRCWPSASAAGAIRPNPHTCLDTYIPIEAYSSSWPSKPSA